MWARVFEFSLACWLAMSPFIFNYPKGDWLFYNDFICSFLIAFFALVSFHRKFTKLHLFNLGIALYLVTLGFLSKEMPLPDPLQNYVAFGLLMGMINIIPSHSHLPPKKWRDFFKD